METSSERLALVTLAAVAAFAACAAAQAGGTVVPAAWATADAPGLSMWPFGAFDARRQLLIDVPMLGFPPARPIAGLSVRRNGDGDTLAGGRVVLDVDVSAASLPARLAREDFAANRGAAPTRVFSGVIDLPSCPPAASPTVPWSAPHAVTIPFASSFQLRGATLCIETTTTPHVDPATGVADQPWWPVDSWVWRRPDAVTSLGTSCWSVGGPEPAGAIAATFAPGSRAVFHVAAPAPHQIAHCAIGLSDRLQGAVALPIPLDPFGAPGCSLQVDPAWLLTSALIPAPRGARAEASVEVELPEAIVFAGQPLFAQWFVVDPTANDLGLAASNGVRATVHIDPNLIQTAWVESNDLSSATGRVWRGRIPVLKFHHR